MEESKPPVVTVLMRPHAPCLGGLHRRALHVVCGRMHDKWDAAQPTSGSVLPGHGWGIPIGDISMKHLYGSPFLHFFLL